jgi:hypothetical protein
VVERFFAWIGRSRRFSRAVERLIASAEAFSMPPRLSSCCAGSDVADQIRNGL